MGGGSIAEALRAVYPRVLARVLARAGAGRGAGALADAEDAVQEAMARALSEAAAGHPPQHLAGWLTRVAHNHLTDGARVASRNQRHQTALVWIAERCAHGPMDAATRSEPWDDDLLRLIVTACDPVLSLAERCALTLATVAGLTSAEIARAFLVSPRAMEQRITRAKRRLAERRQGYQVAKRDDLVQRLPSVLAVIHFLFNEGYWSAGPAPIRRELTALALSLARSLEQLVPNDAETRGLLALLLLHEARAGARMSPEGEVRTLEEQDRTQWHSPTIDEATALLQQTLANGRPGPYQIEAAIAAVHCSADRADETDWLQIALLYEELERLRPSPVVRVQRAFAVAKALGPADGLSLLQTVLGRAELRDYPYLHVVHGTLLSQLNDLTGARAALERALALATNAAERKRIAALIDGL